MHWPANVRVDARQGMTGLRPGPSCVMPSRAQYSPLAPAGWRTLGGTGVERSFAREIESLQLGEGDTFRGEGILAVTKALLQSGVSYVGG